MGESTVNKETLAAGKHKKTRKKTINKGPNHNEAFSAGIQ